jgi:mono/diheme cytochrome c family protein
VLHGEDQVAAQTPHDHSQHDHGGGDMVAHAHGDATRGKTMYVDNCAACHGTEGDGRGPRAYFIFPKPRNFRDPAVQADFDRASLIASITYGVKGREMPAWSKVLTDQQIADIAEYVYVDFIDAEHEHGDGHSGH